MYHPKEQVKHCLKCGSKSFHYNDNNSFKCGDCGFNFFINSAAAVACIITNNNGEILLATRALEPNKGSLDLPGGFVDAEETAENAVKREIKEELNIDVTNLKYLGSYPNKYVFSEYCVFTLDLGFACQVSNLENIKCNDDVSNFEFYSISDIPWDNIFAESIKSVIRLYIDSLSL